MFARFFLLKLWKFLFGKAESCKAPFNPGIKTDL